MPHMTDANTKYSSLYKKPCIADPREGVGNCGTASRSKTETTDANRSAGRVERTGMYEVPSAGH